jgi:hypothetical protein
MSSCACALYREELRALEDVGERYTHTPEIKRTLDLLARGNWTTLYRCRGCGQYWQSAYFHGAYHGGGFETLFQVPSIDPDAWLKNPFPDQVSLAEMRFDLEYFVRNLPDEIGPEECRADDCHRFRMNASVFCKQHHVESLQRIGALPRLPQ